MSKLEYNTAGELELEGQNLLTLSSKLEGPAYVYSKQGLKLRAELFHALVTKNLKQKVSIHYAMKANAHPEILAILKAQGFGVDVVSGGELKKAMDAGFEPRKIIFSGVGKTKAEIKLALQAKIRQLNVESLSELTRIGEISKELNIPGSVVLRLNPGVDPKTHPYISTGFRENKFGIDESQISEFLALIKKYPTLTLQGISSHIGSQLLELGVIAEALRKMRGLFKMICDQGFGLSTFDTGGGVGIDYQKPASNDTQTLENYSQILKTECEGLSAEIQMEPGRILVARSGALLTQVQYIKRTPHKNFVICDSGMNHLLRPALYQAQHRILQLAKRSGEILQADVVGPVCESSDFLGKNRSFEGLCEGDWLAVADAGAYGASMMSDYNAFARASEVFV